jgi:hypothetical protein
MNGGNRLQPRWIALSQLATQMAPLEDKLTTGGGERPDHTDSPELARVEMVSATHGLRINGGEVRIERPNRVLRGSEAKELRVPCVTASSSSKDGPGEEGLPPEGHETLRIEILRM